MMPRAPSPSRRVYRLRGQTVVLGVFGIFGVLTFLGPLLSGWTELPLAGRAVFCGFMVLIAGWFARGMYACIRVEPWGVKVVNPWETTRVPWSEIESFSLGPAAVRVNRVDGSVARAWSVGPSALQGKARRLQGIVDDLNERLERAAEAAGQAEDATRALG
jgi:hypothetical protein